jgi:hypothetical protein
MNPLSFDALSSTSTLIETQGDEHILQLQAHLKKAQNHALFGVKSTHVQAGIHLRDYCESSGNVYLGAEMFDDYAIHYVKKRSMDCQACSNTRVVVLGLAVLGALTYTVPQVLNSNPSGAVIVLFVGAVAFLPPVLFNNVRLLKKIFKKTAQPHRYSAAE